MSTLLKYVMYAIFLALVPAIYLYLYGPPSLVDIASVRGKPKEAAAPVAPVAVASIDEERDYRVAQRLGSPEGLGTPVTFSSNEHQGSHKVWGTQLDEAGHYQPIDLR
jgi:hypothetical protein